MLTTLPAAPAPAGPPVVLRTAGNGTPPGTATAPLPQTAAPLADLLRREIAAEARWTVPAHLGGTAACGEALGLLGERIHRADLWPDQTAFAAALRDAEALAAQAYGAAHAWLLTSGATGGNHAWVAATVRAGETVVVDGACHTSVLAALGARYGARPLWVPRDLHPDLGLPMPLRAADVDAVLRTAPDGVRQVVVTSPTYSGVVSDLAEIADVCRRRGVDLYVDQAWAPHFALTAEAADGLRSGAAGMVVSQHKTGSALSGAAVLLAARGADPDRVDRITRAVGDLRSTSPLLPVLVSSDLARRALSTVGGPGVRRAVALVEALARRLEEVAGVRVVTAADMAAAVPAGDRGELRVDPLKLVVDVTGLARTGWEVAAGLRGRGVLVEGADLERLYLVNPAHVTAEALTAHVRAHDALIAALDAIGADVRAAGAGPERLRFSGPLWARARGEQLLPPSHALERPWTRVPLPDAVGRVAAECVSPYPPGVPVMVPGAVVTEEAVRIVEQVRTAGGQIHGTADPTGASVAVVADPGAP